jgi:hypothetical protein
MASFFIIFEAFVAGDSLLGLTLSGCRLAHVSEERVASIVMRAESGPGGPWNDTGEEVVQFYSYVGMNLASQDRGKHKGNRYWSGPVEAVK